MVKDTYETLGARAPQPCNLGDAHGVAMAFMQPGLTVSPLPFRHPDLLDKEIRIHVTNSGCCHSDIFKATQGWGHNGNFPLVTGHEIVGIIDKIGEKVTDFQIGDRVGFGVFRSCCEECRECKLGKDNYCSTKELTFDPYFGGYATSFQANASHFYKLSDDFPGQAAPLFCAGLTVYHPLMTHLKPGMNVGVIGIGGLGHMGIKFARSMGAEVTAISTTPSKEADAIELGAHHFLNLKDENQVNSLQNSFDFILNTASSINIQQNCGLLKPQGTLNIVGIPSAGEDVHFNLMPVLMKNIRVTASDVGSRNEARDMLEYCRIHNVYPDCEVYRFADTQAAVDSLANGNPHYPKYRNVLEMGSFMETFTPSLN